MPTLTRRQTVLFAAAALAAGPASAADPGLRPTPVETEGPFYPHTLPPETDPDLIHTGSRQARGEPLDLRGRILGVDGRPVQGAVVEIWQCDADGRYIVQGGVDPGFQGYARLKVDAQGEYAFRTIRPVPYDGRTAHIHYKVYRPEGRVLTTQMMIAGNPENERDSVYRCLRPEDRPLSVAAFQPGTDGFAWTTRFDVVLA
ncbi:MAG TPA: hypothetical protein VL358_02655 [Caulobacteraceae bacterium]|nr:hypothetical protein [Caulobacteraceae bacterium]